MQNWCHRTSGAGRKQNTSRRIFSIRRLVFCDYFQHTVQFILQYKIEAGIIWDVRHNKSAKRGKGPNYPIPCERRKHLHPQRYKPRNASIIIIHFPPFVQGAKGFPPSGLCDALFYGAVVRMVFHIRDSAFLLPYRQATLGRNKKQIKK